MIKSFIQPPPSISAHAQCEGFLWRITEVQSGIVKEGGKAAYYVIFPEALVKQQNHHKKRQTIKNSKDKDESNFTNMK